jgi:plastocyanin
MNRSRFLPALIAGLALILAACGETASPTASQTASVEPSVAESVAPSATEQPASEEPSEAVGEDVTVRLSQFAFDTEELTIAVGTEVSWVNADAAAHTVTEGTDGTAAADPIIDEELEQGGATSFTFDEPGTYQITCLFHPSMNMTITVE